MPYSTEPKNHGSYREFENRNDEGIQRGFEFRLDANRGNNHSSATPSDCNDDYNSSNYEGGNNHSSATPSDCNDDYNSSNYEDEDHSPTGTSH